MKNTTDASITLNDSSEIRVSEVDLRLAIEGDEEEEKKTHYFFALNGGALFITPEVFDFLVVKVEELKRKKETVQ